MTNTFISLISRLLALPPLFLVFYSLFRTYWDKLHCINGLRKTRVFLLILVVSLIVDNILFLFFAVKAIYVGHPTVIVSQPLLILDKISLLFAFYGLFYLFKHASKKD